MTRGKIVFINTDDSMYSTREFNGDMHPYRNGQDVIEHFQYGKIQDKESFTRYTDRFIKRYYPYENDTVSEHHNENRVIDISNNRTDYIYIVNRSGSEYKIKTKEGELSLPNNTLCVVDYQKVDTIMTMK